MKFKKILLAAIFTLTSIVFFTIYTSCSACHTNTPSVTLNEATKTPGGSKVSAHNKNIDNSPDLAALKTQSTPDNNELILLTRPCISCGVKLPENAQYCYVCGVRQSPDALIDKNDTKNNKVTSTEKKTANTSGNKDIGAYTISYKDPLFDIERCKKSADAGDITAQYNLAMCYLYGYNVKKSGSDAIKYFRLSANQGNTESARKLGNCYYYGDGIKQDRAEAVTWYLVAANKGDALAQCNLGECYFDGEGVAVDKVQAMYWYLSAAKNGDPTAQEYIGECSLDGVGMAKDEHEAFRWFQKASDQGNITALYNLGWCYNNGVGCEKNEELAIKCLTDASKQGDADATDLLKEIEEVKKKRAQAALNPPADEETFDEE